MRMPEGDNLRGLLLAVSLMLLGGFLIHSAFSITQSFIDLGQTPPTVSLFFIGLTGISLLLYGLVGLMVELEDYNNG